MLVPNRHGSSNSYRYGFQGQEKDDELKGEGNSLNYTFRMHDPRVGRFFAVDPLEPKYPFYSPYQFSGNRVIDMVELEGLEPSESGAREGQKADAFDDRLLTDNPGDLISYLFSYQTWTWHAGTPTSSAGWRTENEYKETVMPFALDAASYNGFKIGTTWQEAHSLLGQKGDTFAREMSNNLRYFLSSREFEGSPGMDMLTDIGAGRMNTLNGKMVENVSGAITPLGYEDPFVFGLAGALRSKFFTHSKVFYTVQGTDDAARLLDGGVPFPNGPTKSFLGEGLYSFGSKSDATKYKAMLENFGATDLKIMTFEVSNYSKLKIFDMRGLSDEAANIWLEGNSFPSTSNFQHIIRPAGNFDEYYFSSSIFKNIKFK